MALAMTVIPRRPVYMHCHTVMYINVLAVTIIIIMPDTRCSQIWKACSREKQQLVILRFSKTESIRIIILTP